MKYINPGVPNSGDFKNGISFLFRIPPDPPKGASEGGGRLGGGLRPIHHKRSCDISIFGLLTVGILKVRHVFLLGYPQTLPRAFLGGGGGRLGPIHNKR